ncbi:MAG: hypothetical protein ABIH23_08860 [bacterium]
MSHTFGGESGQSDQDEGTVMIQQEANSRFDALLHLDAVFTS